MIGGRQVNLLEHYIQPGWRVIKFTPQEKEQMGKYKNEDWIHVDGKIDCYGAIDSCRDTWIRNEWEDAIQRGYYMA